MSSRSDRSEPGAGRAGGGAPLPLRLRLWGALLAAAGRRWPLPPRRWWGRVGEGEFEAVGREIFALVRDETGLVADARVLDLGCGAGRLVAPLRRHLGPAGSYEGLDIVPEFVAWNHRWVTPVDPRFRFQRANVRNDAYFAGGEAAEGYVFPYRDGEFDLVVASSLFTHLMPGAARRYLAECARVLVPGGRLFATFFLLDDVARRQMAAQRTALQFPWPQPFGRIADPDQPEFAVAFEDWAVAAALDESGLELEAGFRRGRWSGLDGPTFQDVVVAARRDAAAPTPVQSAPRWSPGASGTISTP